MFTNNPVFSELKTLYLLLTFDQKSGKFLEKVPIIEYTVAKVLRDILVTPKVVPLEKKKDCFRSCKVQEAKYGNML